MTDKSRNQRRADRKVRDKELLEKYKNEAPKGPGFPWQAKLIFTAVGLILLFIIVFFKSFYIGNTPIKVLDYSLTHSLSTAGRDADLTINIDNKSNEDYLMEAHIQHTFEYVKALVDFKINGVTGEFYIDTDSLAVKEDEWVKYNFSDLIINDVTDISWKPLETILDIRSIPAIEDTFEEYAQYFITQYYNRFSYGYETQVVTTDKTYDAKSIDVTLTEEDFYPLIKEFINFNDTIVDFREGIEDRVKRYLEAVQEYDIYDQVGLSEDYVADYLANFDENFEATYIVFMADLHEAVDDLKPTFEDLDVELDLSFLIVDYKVQSIRALYKNLDTTLDLNQIDIKYVVNDFKHGYIENPVEFEEAEDREPIEIESILGNRHPATIILNTIYDLIYE